MWVRCRKGGARLLKFRRLWFGIKFAFAKEIPAERIVRVYSGEAESSRLIKPCGNNQTED